MKGKQMTKNKKDYTKNKSYIGFYLAPELKKEFDFLLDKNGIKKTDFFLYCIKDFKRKNKDFKSEMVLNWNNF